MFTKDEMEKEIVRCQQEFNKIVSKNINTVSHNNSNISINYKKDDIKKVIENYFITIETARKNINVDKMFDDIKFYQLKDDSSSYSICQFDLNHTKLSDESTIDFDNKYIKIGSNYGHCYGMIKPVKGEDKDNGKEKKNMCKDI